MRRRTAVALIANSTFMWPLLAPAQTSLDVEADVRAFGAKGDGFSDDSDAFNACAFASAGKTMRIPAGTYMLKNVRVHSGTKVMCDAGVVLTLNRPGFVGGSNS